MSTTPVSMSGLVTLSDADHTLLTTLMGLENIQKTMTPAQLAEVLARADALADGMTNEMIRQMTRESLADLRSNYVLPKGAA